MRELSNIVLSGLLMTSVVAGCQVSDGTRADSPATESEAEFISSAPSCQSICDCPRGYATCSGGQCGNGSYFSPLPPTDTWCGATCQCIPGTGCVGTSPGVCTAGTMTASPSTVIVPAGQTTSTFTLTWNAPGISRVDLWGEQNLQSPGQLLYLGSGPGSGSALEPMSVGEVATLKLYNSDNAMFPIAVIQVTGQH